jgi:hypothetical protein
MNLIKLLWAFVVPFRLYFEGEDAGGGGGGGDTLLSSAGAGDDTPPAGQGDPLPAGDGTSTSKPWHVNLWGEDGTINKSNLDNLPEHLKAHRSTFEKYNTAEALFGGFGNASQLAGTKRPTRPAPDAAPEVLEAHNALMRDLNGVPKTAADYGIAKPEGLPDEQWNGEYVNDIATVLHKHNASPELVKELVEMDSTYAAKVSGQAEAAQVEAFKAESAKLAKAFGSNLQQQVDRASRVATTLGLDPASHPMFKNADVVQAFAKMYDKIGEDSWVSGNGGNALAGTSNLEKARSIAFDKSNPLHEAYHNPDHANHARARETAETFYKAAAAAKKKPQ